MERRFEVRLEELLEGAVLDSRIPEGMLDRLERFAIPFAAVLESDAQQRHLREYVAGLFSDAKRKNAETIAYLHDQDRQAMQKFIGQSLWDDGLLIRELARQIAVELGEPDGVLVFDPSGFKKQGKASVGVARQWTPGKDRQLPSRHLSGLRFAQGTRLGGRAALSEPAVGEGQAATETVWRPPRDSLSNAARPRLGNAGRARCRLASRLDCR
jgi:hypothetical protein